MITEKPIETIHFELRSGLAQTKCRRCGCMRDALQDLQSSLPRVADSTVGQDATGLLTQIEQWQQLLEPVQYSCLGCEHCFPAVAMNAFAQAFPEAAKGQSLGCSFEFREQTWPPVPGEYFVCGVGTDRTVAVSTLGSAELAEKLAGANAPGLCIVGKTETENIGIDKVIKNIVSNPSIRVLILAGKDPVGHCSGKTLVALWENGVDEDMRVIGSPGKRPILRNVTMEDIRAFRYQVRVVDLVGNEDLDQIIEAIREVSQEIGLACGCTSCGDESKPGEVFTAPIIYARPPERVEMDRAGYFVIIPQMEKGIITVEHYSYENEHLRTIEGQDARSIYSTIIENGWVTQLSHAAYLGKELARAELSGELGFKYIQDGA